MPAPLMIKKGAIEMERNDTKQCLVIPELSNITKAIESLTVELRLLREGLK